MPDTTVPHRRRQGAGTATAQQEQLHDAGPLPSAVRDGSVRHRDLSGGTSGVNLATIIDPHPDDATALVTHGRAVTYGELRRDVAALRGGLAGLGVGDGDRVALVCGNGSHFAVGYFATIGLGAICVPLNPASPPVELANQLAHVEAKALLVAGVVQLFLLR